MPLKVEPYKLFPVAPRLALLRKDGTIYHEDYGIRPYFPVEKGTQIWGSYDTVGYLMSEEQGQALAWNGSPIRWHPIKIDSKTKHEDTQVLRMDFPKSEIQAIEGLSHWRDWLSEYRAAPLSSLGSSAFSLLRARISESLWLSIGELPPLYCTIGGRQQLGVEPGSYEGPFRHYDLPAAYAQTLGELRYSGRWREVSNRYPYKAANAHGMLCFVRARVSIPSGLPFGPLPRRPQGRPSVWHQVLFPTEFPTGCTMQGVWTTEEIDAAVEAGCVVKQILNVWVHITEDENARPFGVWWQAIQDGRAMRGFAGSLAKATGNSLWGQFCISNGKRSVQSWKKENGSLVRVFTEIPSNGTRPSAFDLAETITGRVRAKLYRFITNQGEHFISAHTDGAWCRDSGISLIGEWRSKELAKRMDILNPQALRYIRPGETEWSYCMAGIPAPLAEAAFQQAWEMRETA